MSSQLDWDTGLLTEKNPEQKFVYDRPWLYPKQEEAIFSPKDRWGKPARFSLIEASTKTGKTVGCVGWLFEQAFKGRRNQNFWWVAPVHGQAEIAYRRTVSGVPARLIKKTHEGSRIELVGGKTIWFKSADNPDSLYGEDVFGAVMDEASRTKEEAFHAVRSTLTATRGPMRMIGNVKGRKNWFYHACRRVEKAGVPGMAYYKIVAADGVEAGILDAAEIENAKLTLPDHVFRELYLAEASEDGGNPFGLSHIRRCFGDMSSDDPVAWGWDLAKSIDWTVGVGLDRDGSVCRFIRFQAPWPETTERIRRETGVTAPALVDSTGVGDPIVDTLQRGAGNFEGFKFSAPSKQKIMEGLAVTVQNHATRFPPSASSPPTDDAANLANEMEEFEFNYSKTGVRYAAPEGFHDDCVCAMALADECRRTKGDLSTWIKLGQQDVA